MAAGNATMADFCGLPDKGRMFPQIPQDEVGRE